MKTIGFVGVGIMGKSMVRNLMKAGFELHIYARTKSKVEDVISEGAIFHDSIKECAAGRDADVALFEADFCHYFSFLSVIGTGIFSPYIFMIS